MHTVEPARLQHGILFHDDVCRVGTERGGKRGKIDAGGSCFVFTLAFIPKVTQPVPVAIFFPEQEFRA